MLRAQAILIFLFATTAFAQVGGEPVFSGPQAGEKLTPFKVHAVSGASAGKQLELISDPKDSPRVLVFVHDITRPALQLLKPLDTYTTKLANEGLESHVVWLTADKSKTEQYLTGAGKSLALNLPIVISADGIEGPGNYGLNRKVALTILVAKGNKVVANFAIVQPNELDAPKVTAAIAKLMGKNPPTLEELQGKAKPPAREKAKDKAVISPELQGLMRQMIQMTNDETTVKRIADEMKKWAGDDKSRQTELRAYCQMVADLEYGTDACKKALKELAGK